MKHFIFEAAELAFKCEMGHANRAQALKNWEEFVKASFIKYGAEVLTIVGNIYDEVADRSGDAWEIFAADSTAEELIEIYSSKAVA